MKASWEFEIETRQNLGQADAIDHVIMDWLKAGDIRPLAWALIMRKPLDPLTLNYVGLMLLCPDEPIIEDGEEVLPYRLEAKERFGKRGNAAKKANFTRDLMLATVVKYLMGQGLTYEAAKAQAAEDWAVGVDTARNAYRRWFGRGKQSGD
jgi:hypothetical protein